MIRLRPLLIALCALLTLPALAAGSDTIATLTGKYLFLNLPGDALQLIPESTRQDMVDYYDAGKTYTPLNSLRGECQLLSLTDTYAKVQVTGVSDVQMCALPQGRSRVAAVVYTVDAGDSPDSQLMFYNDRLQPLPLKKFFKEPDLQSFMADHKNDKALQQLVPFLLLSYQLNPTPGGATLTATLNIKGSMTEEDYARIEPYLTTQSITYTWDGKKFALPSNR